MGGSVTKPTNETVSTDLPPPPTTTTPLSQPPTTTTPLSPTTPTIWSLPTTTSITAQTPTPTTRPRPLVPRIQESTTTTTTRTNQKQDVTKMECSADNTADTDLQEILIEIIRDIINTTSYCSDFDTICRTIEVIKTLGPMEGLSIVLKTYSQLPSEKQISVFHILLCIEMKQIVSIVPEVGELLLPENGLLYFHKNREWSLLAHLILGIQGPSDSCFYQMAIYEDTFNLTLLEILQDFSANIPDWIDSLIERILINGAPCEYLCSYRKAPALHVAGEIAAVSGQFLTFSYVLQWASASKDQLDSRDRMRQTAFERICGLVDDYPLNCKKVLTQLLNKNCQLPDSKSESSHRIPVECSDIELARLRQHIEFTIKRKDYEHAAIYCRRGGDLLLCCHRIKDLCNYYEGLFILHRIQMKNSSAKSKAKQSKCAQNTFTFLDFLENTLNCQKKIKQFDNDIDAILKKIHEKEEKELNRFLQEKSKASESWPMLHFFLIGTKSQPPRLKTFNSSQMTIFTLLELRKSNGIQRSSALALLMSLLENGLLSGHDIPAKIHIILQLTLDIGSLDALNYCLKSNNINVVNVRNETLLHLLVQSEVDDVQFYIKVMKLLLNKGIQKSIKNSDHQKAEDLVTILKLPGALLKVGNISCCDSLEQVMDKVNTLESCSNIQLLVSYCTIGMALLLETGIPALYGPKLVKFCTISATATFALGYKGVAKSDLALATKYCNSFKDILLISNVYHGQGDNKMSLKCCEQAYKFILPSIDKISTQIYVKEILYEIIKITVDGINMTAFSEFRTKPDIFNECKALEHVFLQYLPLLFTIGNEAVKKGEDLYGAFAFNTLFAYLPYLHKDFLKILNLRQLNTSVFKLDVMQKLLIEFVRQNLDLRKLELHDGDTYLHSCVRLSLYYGYFDLLELIVNFRAIKNNELHIMDNNKRTAFDLLRLCRDGNFHEGTLNIMLKALSQVKNKKKTFIMFTHPVYLYDGNCRQNEEGRQESRGMSQTESGTAMPAAAAWGKTTVTEWGTVTVSNRGRATAAVGKGGIATTFVDNDGIITTAVGKGGIATAAGDKGGIATAAVGKGAIATTLTGNGGIATAAVGKGGGATAAVGKGGRATAAGGKGGRATAAVGKGGRATAAVGKGAIATTLTGNGGIATAAVGKGGGATAAVGKGGRATAAGGKGGRATAAGGKGRGVTAAVGKGGIATTAVGKGGIATAAGGKGGIATAAGGKGRGATAAVGKGRKTTTSSGKRRNAATSTGKGGIAAAAGGGVVAAQVRGDLHVFETLLKLYKSDKKKYSSLDPYIIEQNGKYHLSEDFPKYFNEILNSLNLLPTAKKAKKRKHQKKYSQIPNNEQKASEVINKNASVNPQPEISVHETRLNQEDDALKFVPGSLESEMRANIESLTQCKFEEMNSMSMIIKEKSASETITKPDKKIDICIDFNPDVIEDCEQSDDGGDGDDSGGDDDYDDDQNEEDLLKEENLFENLDWKVICTQDVWNTLKSRDLTVETRRQAISAIIKLASGYKTRHLRKLKHIPKSLKLYTIHLSSHSRIIWQLTIDYVPELERYSDVLCIWKLVFNLNKLKSIINNIVKCLTTSLSLCPQYLKPVQSTQTQSDKWLPRVFEKCENNNGKDICQSYLTIDNENELNIMKFYRFSSSLVRYIFQESMLDASFPFEVKEAEYKIIADNGKEAVIVLGRSGTGKTTCCLYRLWNHYIIYWKQANISEMPLFRKLEAKSLDHIRDNKVTEYHDEVEESEDEQSEDDVNDTDVKDLETKDDPENYCHLHQLFISRNNCLCTEMQKNFKNLCTGENISENHMEFSGFCFQDLQDNNFPLFLTSKKCWALIDASLGSPYFFPRNEDLSLRSDFKNWLDEDSSNLFDMYTKETDITETPQYSYEVTYDVFVKEFWNRVKYTVSDCHPTLIWTEIMSIIKGSYKSLLSDKGFLSENEYFEIGKKQAPNFTSDRKKIYQVFMRYNKILKERGLFDEMDIVFNLFSRLCNSKSNLCPIHEIYVDEVQDFTQAELFLMILLVENPNNMFLTGDTAQSIMRGVAFRFCDLKSLFYYLKEICSNLKQLHSINVPQTMHHLTCNYRSHSGVVSLASSVLDLLNRYFPESFDKTEKDIGTYEGPIPKIFEFCKNEDLAMLLGGERQTLNQIEFGAHQAVLVANNQAKQELPSFLSSSIVLTIAESKGLEFNDILLYNFFKDSLVTDEWRIITSYLQELVKQTNEDGHGNGQRLTELNLDILDSQNRLHPLTFDPNKHKILNSELKYLYTALTRAKHNIWIFDKSHEKRAPIFEYFQVLGLVESVNTSNEDPNNAEFARSSTPEEWFKKGMFFSERKHFEIAIKCFQKSGHKKEENVATAFQYVQQAQTLDSAAKKQRHYLIASKYFFYSSMHIRSAWCLSEGGKYELSARLYQKCHKYKEAAVNFKNAKLYADAVHCYLKISEYGKAVDMLHNAKQYNQAIELIKKYKALEQSYGDSVPEDFIKNRPTKDICYLAQQAANIYYQCKDHEKMKAALLHFTTLEDKLNFLEKKRLFTDAAELLRNNGQIQSSMDLLWRNNLFSESVEVAATLNDNKNYNNLYADCLYKRVGRDYVVAKLKTTTCVSTSMTSDAAADSVGNGDSADIDMDTNFHRNIEADLKKVQQLYKNEGNHFGQGKCHLLLAKLNEANTKCTIDAVEAFNQFKSIKFIIGCLEAVQFFTHIDPDDFYKESFWCVIRESLDLVNMLKTSLQSSKLLIKSYLPYFGLSFKDGFVWKSYTTEPLCCISLIKYGVCNKKPYASFTFDKFKSWLNKYLKFSIRTLFQILYQKLIIHIITSTPCPFESAELCQSSDICHCHLANFYGSQFSQSEGTSCLCRFQDKQCMHFHESSTLPRFDPRLVICQMLLTIKLLDNYEEFEFFATHLYKVLISNSAQDIHLSDYFHPDNTTALKTCVRDHYKMVFRKKSLLEKVQSSDFYLEVHILFSWLNITFDVEKLMQLMYKQIENDSFPNVSILNTSLISSDNIYMCIYQRFYDSLYFLYEKEHPFEAVIQFSKFTTLFLKKRKHILPDLNCLLMWIEYFMAVSFMLLMRHCRISVVMPSSYISTTDFIDTLQPKSSEQLQVILNCRHMWLNLKLLKERMAKMVNLIFSDKSFQCLHNKDVNSKEVAKRFWILGLTYVHCFSEYPFQDTPDLRFLMMCENTRSLVEDSSLRVKDICSLILLNKAGACKIIKDVVKSLMLTQEYYWMFKSGKPAGLHVVSDGQIPMLSLEVDNTSPTIVSEIDSEITEGIVEDLISKDEKDKNDDFKKQMKAVQVIERAYLRYRNKLLKELGSLHIPVSLPMGSSSEIYCSTCAASFSSKQWITPLKINVSNNGSFSSDWKETVFEHLKNPAHSAKILEFKEFSKLYEAQFLPVIENVKHDHLNLVCDNEEISYYLDVLKLKLQQFDKIINQICQNANWTETELLETIVKNIQHFVKKAMQLHEKEEL